MFILQQNAFPCDAFLPAEEVMQLLMTPYSIIIAAILIATRRSLPGVVIFPLYRSGKA